MNSVILPAHFDGQQIVLDAPYELQPNTPLTVTVISEDAQDREEWYRLSEQGLAAAYGDDEPEYTLDMIKEWNPEYEGRGRCHHNTDAGGRPAQAQASSGPARDAWLR